MRSSSTPTLRPQPETNYEKVHKRGDYKGSWADWVDATDDDNGMDDANGNDDDDMEVHAAGEPVRDQPEEPPCQQSIQRQGPSESRRFASL